MGLVRDLMRMDLDPPPVEKPKRFRYMGELKDMPSHPENPYVKLTDDQVYMASENVVVKYNTCCTGDFRLYVWDGKRWTDFHPGPCTDYDGPRPGGSYERRYLGKRIYPSTRGIHDTANPFHKMIQEKTDELMKHLGFEHKNDTATEIFRNFIDNTGIATYNLKYIGETDTNVRDNPKGWLVQIIHHTGSTIGRRTISPQIGFVVSYKDVEYAYTGPETGWVAINNYRKEKTEMPVRYDRVYPRLAIKKVIFNAPATIVFWDDGTKTVVKCENEEYDPEKGLAMAVAKKALGNQGNYYNQFKKWLPSKEEEGPTVIIPDIGSPLHEAAKRLAEGVNNALSGLKKDSE